MKKFILLTLLFSVTKPTLAGGDYFPVTLESIEENGVEFTLIAKPIFEEKLWFDDECRTVKVTGSYDRLIWQKYQKPMSEEAHYRSIEVLKKSINDKVNLGFIGNGLRKVDHCVYKSKGLFGNNKTIFSVHDSI